MLFSEPSTRYDDPDPQREDEAIREQRWTVFVETMRHELSGRETFAMLLHDVGVAWVHASDCYELSCNQREMLNFAETEGWPGVLNAIARAMKDEQQIAVECERRR